MILLKVVIQNKRMLTETTAKLILRLPKDYPGSTPGQFIRVKCAGRLLPLPISICWVGESKKPLMSLVVEARGPGTDWLVSRRSNETIEISDPIGNGFKVLPDKQYLIVGGGIGIPPLFYAFKQTNWSADSILCFKTVQKVILKDEFTAFQDELVIATDDGSYGLEGRADEVLYDFLSKPHPEYEAILACGPKAMLAAVAKIAREFNIPCQVSLEEYMACGGAGACLGCAVRLKSGMGTVCKDGPVFDAEEVIWDD